MMRCSVKVLLYCLTVVLPQGAAVLPYCCTATMCCCTALLLYCHTRVLPHNGPFRILYCHLVSKLPWMLMMRCLVVLVVLPHS
jgi:hypothetical protein